MMIPRDELIDAVAICIARDRVDVPVGRYERDRVRIRNVSGWSVEFHTQRVVLTDDELEMAWIRSGAILRAWA